jgi:membrane peptidoglycan carboxypeptidase
MGHQEGTKSMFDSTINGQFHRLVYGGRIPAPTWRNYVTAALNGVPHQPFPPVPPTALYGDRIPVPDVAGRSAAEAQTILTQAGFQVRIGSPVNSGWQAGAAVATNPGAGTRAAPGTMITVIPSAGPAPAPPPPPPAPEPAPAPPEPAEPAEPPSENPGNGNGPPDDEDDD